MLTTAVMPTNHSDVIASEAIDKHYAMVLSNDDAEIGRVENITFFSLHT